MRVLSVAFPFAPVSLDAVGGAEQVVAMLDRGLASRGHQSVVVARSGSHIQGEFIEIPPTATSENYQKIRDVIDDAIQRLRPDLVHMHGLDFWRYLPRERCPVLATLHLPPSFYPAAVFHLDRPRTWLNCVSGTQLLQCPSRTNIAGVVPNGIPVDLLVPAPDPAGDYLVAIGRVCPEKGYHLAVEAAENAGLPLYFGGNVFPYPDHIRYWRETLAPRLRPPHRFLGPVGMSQKVALLGGARCLLVPSLVPETSSLVAMEALACGTPVVAFAAGALTEIVEPNRTGFLVNSTGEMADAARRAGELNRPQCHDSACARFSAEAMLAKYLNLYHNLIGRSEWSGTQAGGLQCSDWQCNGREGQ